MMHSSLTQTHAWPTYTFRAMGSQIKFWLEADPILADDTFAQVEALFADNERALSRFQPDSELSQLNGRPNQWIPVSDLLWDVLTRALVWAEITNGLFDPTILTALEATGYTQSFDKLGEMGRNGRLPCHTFTRDSWAAIQLDSSRRAVWLPEGIRIDLGGIAKGYTAQQAVQLLTQYGPCLVDAGGDLTAGTAPHGYPGWPVAIAAPWADPNIAQENLMTLWLAETSLATSGIDYRRWVQNNGFAQNNRFAHHIIDPRTGHPADTDAITATILAQDAIAADVWATVMLILGTHD
ncbi:MAG: FAD:protein FMN transferase, partial [Chloroflexi bacterium]|nr:FAD:protein FMN transferase [Chloroflexota bacterium]